MTESTSASAYEPAARGRGSALLEDLVGAIGGAAVALLLLRYLHDGWRPE